MSSEVRVTGELVFWGDRDFLALFGRIGVSIEALRSGKAEMGDVKIEEVVVKDGRVHVKFEGKVDWPSKLAPQGENPLDWLKTQVRGLVWDVEVLKNLEVFRSSDDLRFEFYSDEELEKKREEYNRWWMDSASNIVALF